ncbi:MAG: hypothetical protein KBT58_09540, partial [Bizionia sp.]|nr:hypothetical protein [Bizionia sp.]
MLFTVSINAVNVNLPSDNLSTADSVAYAKDFSSIESNQALSLNSNTELPELSVSSTYCCSGSQVTLTINGNLNGNSLWYIYKNSCGGNLVGVTSGNSYILTVNTTTTFYVSAGQGNGSNCASITVNVNSPSNPPATACYETATYDDASCAWIITGTQPDQPTTACYETATFNEATCSWDVTGTQPDQPNTACYETATFNEATCSWDVTGTQPDQPNTACYETATFNEATCSWDVT